MEHQSCKFLPRDTDAGLEARKRKQVLGAEQEKPVQQLQTTKAKHPCAAGTVPWQEVSGPRISVGPGHHSLELTFCWREAALMYCMVLIDLMAFSSKVSVRRAQAGRALEVLQNLFILWQWIL